MNNFNHYQIKKEEMYINEREIRQRGRKKGKKLNKRVKKRSSASEKERYNVDSLREKRWRGKEKKEKLERKQNEGKEKVQQSVAEIRSE